MLKNFLLQVPAGLHLEWKIQSALKGFSMKEYVILALHTQIEKDKSNVKKEVEDTK